MADDKDLDTGFAEEEDEIITLTDEEGKEHEFVVVDVIEVSDKEYAILLPIDTEDDEEAEAVILRLERTPTGTMCWWTSSRKRSGSKWPRPMRNCSMTKVTSSRHLRTPLT